MVTGNQFEFSCKMQGQVTFECDHVLLFLCVGCEDCNNANPGACIKHGPLHPILSRPVMSKARASLPLVLYIDRFLGGVFTKRRIPKRTTVRSYRGAAGATERTAGHAHPPESTTNLLFYSRWFSSIAFKIITSCCFCVVIHARP